MAIKQLDIKTLVDQYLDINFSVTRKFEQLILKEIGDVLTTEQHFTLRYIYQVKKCTSTELANIFQVNKSAITSIINRLVEKQYITRNKDDKDRRLIYLSLTEEGEEVFKKMEVKICDVIQNILQQIDPSEITCFMNTYTKLERLVSTYECMLEGEKE